MGLPVPTSKKKEVITSKRSVESERLSSDELNAWMKKNGIGDKELAEIFGVTIQAVKLWTTGQRDFSITNSRLINLFKKYPQLIREF
jgi:DNA-binding transcriptional regulator YiaG